MSTTYVPVLCYGVVVKLNDFNTPNCLKYLGMRRLDQFANESEWREGLEYSLGQLKLELIDLEDAVLVLAVEGTQARGPKDNVGKVSVRVNQERRKKLMDVVSQFEQEPVRPMMAVGSGSKLFLRQKERNFEPSWLLGMFSY